MMERLRKDEAQWPQFQTVLELVASDPLSPPSLAQVMLALTLRHPFLTARSQIVADLNEWVRVVSGRVQIVEHKSVFDYLVGAGSRTIHLQRGLLLRACCLLLELRSPAPAELVRSIQLLVRGGRNSRGHHFLRKQLDLSLTACAPASTWRKRAGTACDYLVKAGFDRTVGRDLVSSAIEDSFMASLRHLRDEAKYPTAHFIVLEGLIQHCQFPELSTQLSDVHLGINVLRQRPSAYATMRQRGFRLSHDLVASQLHYVQDVVHELIDLKELAEDERNRWTCMAFEMNCINALFHLRQLGGVVSTFSLLQNFDRADTQILLDCQLEGANEMTDHQGRKLYQLVFRNHRLRCSAVFDHLVQKNVNLFQEPAVERSCR
jgi:hypothetical protein